MKHSRTHPATLGSRRNTYAFPHVCTDTISQARTTRSPGPFVSLFHSRTGRARPLRRGQARTPDPSHWRKNPNSGRISRPFRTILAIKAPGRRHVPICMRGVRVCGLVGALYICKRTIIRSRRAGWRPRRFDSTIIYTYTYVCMYYFLERIVRLRRWICGFFACHLNISRNHTWINDFFFSSYFRVVGNCSTLCERHGIGVQ